MMKNIAVSSRKITKNEVKIKKIEKKLKNF